MVYKEHVNLMEQNMIILEWLSGQLKDKPKELAKYSRQHLHILVRLHLYGNALLKDLAVNVDMPTSNLCSVFRNLEAKGLVKRTVDKDDRRNTWYSLTSTGIKVSELALASLRDRLTELFVGLSKSDEKDLTNALKTMNSILTKLKEQRL